MTRHECKRAYSLRLKPVSAPSRESCRLCEQGAIQAQSLGYNLISRVWNILNAHYQIVPNGFVVLRTPGPSTRPSVCCSGPRNDHVSGPHVVVVAVSGSNGNMPVSVRVFQISVMIVLIDDLALTLMDSDSNIEPTRSNTRTYSVRLLACSIGIAAQDFCGQVHRRTSRSSAKNAGSDGHLREPRRLVAMCTCWGKRVATTCHRAVDLRRWIRSTDPLCTQQTCCETGHVQVPNTEERSIWHLFNE